MKKTEILDDTTSHWFGMQDYQIKLALSPHIININYIGEPPFGDSYHSLSIDDVQIDGYVWGCKFMFPYQQRYLMCSWMADLYERKTIIIQLSTAKIHVLKEYWYDYKVKEGIINLSNDDFKTTIFVEPGMLKNWFDDLSLK